MMRRPAWPARIFSLWPDTRRPPWIRACSIAESALERAKILLNRVLLRAALFLAGCVVLAVAVAINKVPVACPRALGGAIPPVLVSMERFVTPLQREKFPVEKSSEKTAADPETVIGAEAWLRA